LTVGWCSCISYRFFDFIFYPVVMLFGLYTLNNRIPQRITKGIG